jgi:hypothetical protein
LLLEAPECQRVVAQRHVDRPQVAMGTTLSTKIANVLQNRQLLQEKKLLEKARIF